MRKTLEELIEVGFDIKNHLNVGHYDLHHYEDGSYIDLRTRKINSPRELIDIASGLDIRFFADENEITVRLFEREE